MAKQNSYRESRFPPTNYLAAAMKSLPRPGPDILPHKVAIDVGQMGSYSVTFIARLDGGRKAPVWFWGIGSSVPIPPGAAESAARTGWR